MDAAAFGAAFAAAQAHPARFSAPSASVASAAARFSAPLQPWRLGELLWKRAAVVSRGETLAARLEARALLLRAVRCTPPGAEFLCNAYLRLAGLVYTLATGKELGGALAPSLLGGAEGGGGGGGAARRELSGAEGALLTALLARAEAARGSVLGLHRATLARRGAGAGSDEGVTAILRGYAAALGGEGRACEGCGRARAGERCERCASPFCSAACFEAAWRARPGVAPHKAGCRLLARARAQVLEMAEYGSRREALDEDLAAALGREWRLLHPCSAVHREVPHLD